MIAIDDSTILSDETAPEIITDLDRTKSSRLKDLLNRLVSKAEVTMALAALNQRNINAANQRIETRMMEGIGQRFLRVDRAIFFNNMHQHGNDCWGNPDFLHWFSKQVPGATLHLHVRKYFNGVNLGNRKPETGLRKEKQKR